MQNRQHELEKARRYLSQCEDAVTSAMHCDDETFRAATKALRQAQIRCEALEGAAVTKSTTS
jgi:hypothetical protein